MEGIGSSERTINEGEEEGRMSVEVFDCRSIFSLYSYAVLTILICHHLIVDVARLESFFCFDERRGEERHRA